MYLSNFEARAFLGGNMHALVRQQISQVTVSKMKQRQQTMMPFLSTAEKSQRQTGNNNFRN